MDVVIVAVLAVVMAVVSAVTVRMSRARSDAGAQVAAVQQGMQANVALLQQAITELRTANQQAVTELRGDVQRSLGATEQQLITQTGATQRSLGDLSRQLGQLGEQSARIGDLAKDIGSLHDLLRAPKLRGGFGELLMERILEDSLPADSFELQYGYRDGSRVDAVVHFGGRLVPIDAKFPMESFNALAVAEDEGERKARRRAFIQQIKRHVDAVSRYIAPQEGTIDFALMYMPAENVYYQAVIVDDADSDLREYCAQKKVIPTSPNTLLAYLQLVSFGLRGLAMQERTRELHEGIRHAALEIEKFRVLHDQLGRHLENAGKKFTESVRGLDRATDAVEALGRTQVAPPQQGKLPLPRTPDELLDDALGLERDR